MGLTQRKQDPQRRTDDKWRMRLKLRTLTLSILEARAGEVTGHLGREAK